MVGPWTLAPHHDPLQYIHHIHLMQRGQNWGVTLGNWSFDHRLLNWGGKKICRAKDKPSDQFFEDPVISPTGRDAICCCEGA